MEWEEINRRLRNGTSVSVLAELAGTTYKNMYNRIRRREQIDGKQYLKPEQLKRPYKAQGGRKKAAFLEKKLHIPEEKKNVPDPGPAASNSSNVTLCESCRHFRPGTATDRPYCRKYEHGCGLIYVCEGYAAGGPEVEPIGEEKAPDVPEVVREFAGIPEGVVKDTLERYRKEHAAADRKVFAMESIYKQAKAEEMKLRTVVLALERLLKGE